MTICPHGLCRRAVLVEGSTREAGASEAAEAELLSNGVVKRFPHFMSGVAP